MSVLGAETLPPCPVSPSLLHATRIVGYLVVDVYNPDDLRHLRLQFHMSAQHLAHIHILHSRLVDWSQSRGRHTAVQSRRAGEHLV